MAKKGKNQQKQTAAKHVTTRRLARWQREKRRQRITFLSGVIIIAVVLAIIIGGVVATRSSDWLSKVKADSGTVTIRKADYADELKLLFAIGRYNSSTITNEAPLKAIEESLIIEDGAKEAGLSVTEDEVTDIIRNSSNTDNGSITDADFQEQYQAMLDYLGISDTEYREVISSQLLYNKLTQYYIDLIPPSGEQASVETIVVYNESTAFELCQEWRGGGNFETLSEKYGNLSSYGWLIKGTQEEAFDNTAFSIEIGNVSDPILSERDETAYYVIKVLDRKDGPIEETLRQNSGQAKFEKWYYQAYTDKVERNPKLDLAETYAWAVAQLQ